MASNPISSIGVGSGLPLGDLLTQLRTNENAALKIIQSQHISAQNKLSAYSKVKSALSDLQSAAQKLNDPNTYGALKTSVTGDSLTVSASADAIAGQYSITVDQMAKAQSLVTSGLADSKQANGTGGTITFTLSDGTSKTLDLSGKETSLDGLINAINSDPDLDVNATMINDGSSSPFHLLLTAKDTGTDAAVTSISSTNSALQDILGFSQGTPSANITEHAASNATIHINGIEVTSQSNHIEDAIAGVTMNLKEVDATAATVSIVHDDSTTTKVVKDFVSAYNSLQSTMQSLTSYDAASNTGSALTGDSLARKVQNQVRDILNDTLPSGSVRSLYQLGIGTNPDDGSLTIDDDKLNLAIQDHPGDVQNLLGGPTGIGKRIDTLVGDMLSTRGLISTASDSMTQTIDDLATQYDQASRRIDTRMESYRRQFTALDTMVAQMNSVSSYLTQQLQNLGTQSG